MAPIAGILGISTRSDADLDRSFAPVDASHTSASVSACVAQTQVRAARDKVGAAVRRAGAVGAGQAIVRLAMSRRFVQSTEAHA